MDLKDKIAEERAKFANSTGQKLFLTLNKIFDTNEFVHIKDIAEICEKIAEPQKFIDIVKHHHHPKHTHYSPTCFKCTNVFIFYDNSTLSIDFIDNYCQEISAGMTVEATTEELKQMLPPEDAEKLEKTRNKTTFH